MKLIFQFLYRNCICGIVIKTAKLVWIFLQIKQFRVRHHDDIARIEVTETDFIKILLNRDEIISYFKKLGFVYVTLDLQGYRSGSLNEVLKKRD